MRILHVNHFGAHVGGVEGYVADVSRALAAAGHETRLLSLAVEDPCNLMPGTVQVNAASTRESLAGMEQVILQYRPDVAFVHAVYDAAVVRWISERVPSVAYMHGPYPICPGNALYLRKSDRVCERTAGAWCLANAQIERCCFGHNPLRHATRLRNAQSLLGATAGMRTIVGSEFMRGRLLANGFPPGQIRVLAPVLLDEAAVEATPVTDHAVVLFSGRITPEKGLRRLIEALALTKGDWRLIVAGDGPDRNHCEQLAAQLGIASRIQFEGWVGPARMQDLYRGCAFVALPSLWPEPYGRIGPEAFAHGRPAVAYAVGGVPDWLDDGKTGLLVSPGDIAGLSAALSRLLACPEEQQRMGRAAAEQARTRWNGREHARSLVGTFQEAIDGFALRGGM